MLSDEEKKAIETLKSLKDIKWYEHAFDNGTEVLEEGEKQDIDIVLNLIKKQSKEIEELKVINQMQKYRIEVIDERELISKDKIKAKIEELDYNDVGNFERRCKQEVLQSLLEKE